MTRILFLSCRRVSKKESLKDHITVKSFTALVNLLKIARTLVSLEVAVTF